MWSDRIVYMRTWVDDPTLRPDFGVMLAAVAATRVEVGQLAEPARSEAMADLVDLACDILGTG